MIQRTPDVMITLTPITEPAKLEEYFRFRYRIYSESRQAGVLNGSSDGLNVDAFDARALHFGWYVNGALAGCVRFVEPDESADALPMLSYMREGGPREAVKRYIAERRRRNERMVEASRFCLAPEHRGLSTAREFVLAMLRALRPYGVEHGLFDCDEKHAGFYRSMGFALMPGAERWKVHFLDYTTTILEYDLRRMLRRDPRVLREGGLGLHQWSA